MRITGVDTYICRFPNEAPFAPSWTPGLTSHDNGCAIHVIKTDEGIEGYAGGMSIAREMTGLAPLFQAYLMGRDPLKINAMVNVLRNSTRVLGYRAGHLDVALWDIAGKAAGLPLYRLFGADKEKVHAYASFGELRSPGAWAEAAVAAREAGFRAMKVRIRHETIAEDVAVVRAVRETVGDSMAIMADANQGWRIEGFQKTPWWDLNRAKKTAKALEETDLTWLEEPLDQWDARGYAALRQSTTTPIAGGEMLPDLGPFALMIEAGAYDIVQPDTSFCGGISIARKVATLAEAAGLLFAPHTWTNGLGLAANLHVLASAPSSTWLEFPWDPPGWTPTVRDAMLSAPIEIDSDGCVALPDSPGLGVELDFDRILAHGEKL